MMKKITILSLGLIASFTSFSQLTTPGNGVNYDLASLSALDPNILSFDGTKYLLSDDLIISENDTLEITTPDTLLTDADKRITIEGSFIVDPGVNNNKFYMSSTDVNAPSDGLRFEEFSVGKIKNAHITNTGGLKVLTEDFSIEDSRLAYNVSGVSTGATISFSRGAVEVKNNLFYYNDLPAVSSGANQQVPAQIIGNTMEGNGVSNQNRPQINMGPTGSDTLRIINNTIIGDTNHTKVGGISVANFISGSIYTEIENNVIQENRYGITIMGANATALIKGNIIEDNNTQNSPNLGGSGISLNSADDSQAIVVRENKIRRNLWGITVIDKASVDLGTSNDLGNNLFSDNGNGGETFALYNNTSFDISAMGNCWIETNPEADSAAIEGVVFHSVDDNSLGTVDFSNWSCGILSTNNTELKDFAVYPNPTRNELNIENNNNFYNAVIYDLKGILMQESKLDNGVNTLQLDLPAGLYILTLSNGSEVISKKIVVE